MLRRRLLWLLSLFGLVSKLFSQALLEHGIAFVHGHIADGQGKRFFAAHQYQRLLGPRDSGIDQVPLEHHIMRHEYWHHNDRVLTALGFVYRCGIGQHQLVKLRHIIDNQTVVKLDAQLPILRVNLLHDADVAVEDLFFVVVADLHDLVAPAVFHSPAAQA